MSVFGRQTQFLDACLPVRLRARGMQEPAHWSGLEAEQIILKRDRDIAVVVSRMSRQAASRLPCAPASLRLKRRQAPLFDQRL